jgi:hypothetical protein
MTIELTRDEVDLLIDAVKAWEKEPETDGTMKMMLTSLFDATTPEFSNLTRAEKEQHLERSRRGEKNKIEAMTALRRETSILLQAKLIQARQAQPK